MNSLEKRGYFLGDNIGKGAFSKVVRACYEKGGKRTELCCKIVDKEEIDSKFVKKFFPRELDVLRKLKNHPNLIGVHSILERRNIVYIFMRWAENGDMVQWLKNNQKASESQANLWFFQLVVAVKYLHSLNYAHRDIKPENIFLSANWNVKLGDFGFVRSCVNEKNMTILSKTFCGSEAYAAPEILETVAYSPKKVDMYALGAVLYTMLVGQNPYNFSTSKRAVALSNQKIQKFANTASLEQLSFKCVNLIYDLMEYNPLHRPDIETVYSSQWLMARSDRATRSL